MSMVKDLQRKFALATPQQKRFWVLTGSAVIFVTVLYALSAVKPPPPKRLSDKTDSKIIAPPKRNIDLESMAATLTNIQRQMNEMQSRQNMSESAAKEANARTQGQLQDVVQGKIGGDGLSKEVETMVARRIEKMKADGQLAMPGNGNGQSAGNGRSGAGGGQALGAPLPAAPDISMPPILPRDGAGGGDAVADGVAPGSGASKRPKLRQITATDEPAAEGGKEQGRTGSTNNMLVNGMSGGLNGESGKNTPNATSRDRKPGGDSGATHSWIPAGSILTGVLITGMDAPTSQAAAKNPTPALVRIKFDATLPNHFTVDIKECFALVDGYGQLSSERALLRSQRLTCVRQDGGVIEANLDGYVTGEDGKVGMRGRLVTKEGAMIARTLTAGMLGALGHRLGGTGSNGSGLSVGQNGGSGLSIGAIGESAESGIGVSFSKVADFYLDMAKEMVPVIEIDAGRQITIVLVHGVSIKNTKS